MVRAMTLIALACAGAMSVVAPSASADSAYRYWSYWTSEAQSQQWSYATEGSGTRVPADGDVEGWRFGLAGEASRIQPSITANFDEICSGQQGTEATKRVAVVIDPGDTSAAPPGEQPGALRTECVLAPTGATGYQVLLEIAQVRNDAGFVCGIDGYPESECAPLVQTSETTSPQTSPQPLSETASEPTNDIASAAAPSGESTDIGTPLITAGAISVLALTGFALWRRGKRRS
ncbi:MAG TPA: SCO2322 family protein [Candidatus Nanopelagicales bacterium]|nr:SCO2322 family protein [Candidatus Nanopelagicales bacterium]